MTQTLNENQDQSAENSSQDIQQDSRLNCFILTGEKVNELRISQKEAGSKSKTALDKEWGWCFSCREDAEKISEKLSQNGKEFSFRPFFSEIARRKWHGTTLEKKAAGLETKYLIEKQELDAKKENIKNECDKQKFDIGFLYKETPPEDFVELQKKTFYYLKPLFEDWKRDKQECEESQKKLISIEEEIKKGKTTKSLSQNLNKYSESEDEEIEEHSSKDFVKAISNARRRALIYHSTHEEIVRDICKQYPTLLDQAEDIATKALLWAEKYRIDCEVIVNGIPKKVTDMQSLDSRFAQLEAPGQPCVTIHRSDAQPISITDFNKRLSGEVVISGVGEKGQPKYLDASTFWTGNTRKYIYKSIVFTNKPVGNDTYNLFTGFGVKPKKGICDKILSHIKDVICADNEINYTALLKLLSWQIQNIGKPSRIITALKSKAQQAGKGCLLADIMAVIYGNSGFTTSDLGQIITRFNDTIRGKAFIFLDEALFAGDRKSADAIKSLATSTRMGVESKNIPTVQFPIAVNLFLSTNHDDAAHVEESDARYWILEVSPHRVGDTDYFQDLYAEIEGGGREAFMHYLLEINVKDFVPSRDVPTDNEYKEAMIRNSINPYDARKWLEECCRAEMILGLKPIDEDSNLPWEGWQKGMEYSNGIFHTAYTEWQKTIKSPIAPKPTPGNKFGELLNAAGLQLRIDGKRFRTLPEPSDCLKIVTEMIEKIGK